MEYKDSNKGLKARLALEALKGEKTVEELAEEHNVTFKQVKEWVDHLKSKAITLFTEDKNRNNLSDEATIREELDKLRDYISLLRAALDATANGILVIDTEQRIVTYNERFMKMWEIPEHVMAQGEDEKVIRYVLDQLKHPDKFQRRIKELYNNPEDTSQDVLEFKDGRIFDRYSFPQRLEGKIIGRVWSFMDVTETRVAQEKMNRFGQLLKSINANVEEGILRSTPEDGLIYVNDAFLEMFGYQSKEEALSVPPENYYADANQRWELFKKMEKNGKVTNEEVKFLRKDGTTFWGLENSTLVETDGQRFIDGVVNDITHRKEVEEALRQSEEKYRTIIENIEDGYFETDLAGNFTFVNESLQRVFGYPRTELLGMNNRDYMDEENAQNVYQAFNRVYQTGEPEQGYDWEIITKHGKKHFVEASISLKKDSEGMPTGFRGIVRDITARKRHEEQVKASLKEKVVLLGEIHHRVKNNLAVISGLLYMQAQKTEDENARSLLKQSQSRIHSMAMIHEMLYDAKSFSSIDPDTYIRKLIDYIIQNLDTGEKEILTEVITGDIQLHMNIAIPCALIINELLTNAYKYAFEGRDKGKIRVRFDKLDSNYRIELADNGVGLPEKKEPGLESSDGLGLLLVETLTKQIKGDLEIERNEGTRFSIIFPAQ